MNRIYKIILAIILLLTAGCKQDEASDIHIEGETAISVSCYDEVTEVAFTATSSWTASTDCDWCIPDKSSGPQGSNVIRMRTEINDTYEVRTAHLTIKLQETGLSRSVTFTQEDNKAIILEATRFELDNSAQTITVKVQQNVNYSVSSDSDWIVNNTTKSLSTETLIFDIGANENYDPRSGLITITPESSELTPSTIKVYQSATEAIILSQKDYSLNCSGHTLRIDVKTNVETEVSIPSQIDWITREDVATKGLSSETIVLGIGANTDYWSRSAEVTISSKSTGMKETVSIVQGQMNVIQLFTDNIQIARSGDSFSVSMTHNVPFIVVMPEVDWLKMNTAELTTDERQSVCSFTAGPNEGEEARDAFIIFRDSLSTTSDTLKVRQWGVPRFLDMSEPGVYIGETQEIAYQSASSQYSLGHLPDGGFFRIIRPEDKTYCSIEGIPSLSSVDDIQPEVDIKMLQILSEKFPYSAEYHVTLLKKDMNRVWLYEGSTDTGFIILIDE